VDALGWIPFFFITFLVSLPGIILLVYLRSTVTSYEGSE
jgi:uncharacterized membrane protein YdjX (TVP38/TMEM64 family)